MFIRYDDLTIQLSHASNFDPFSADNSKSYTNAYIESNEFRNNSLHGISVYKNEDEISNAVIGAGGGATGIHQTCCLIKNDVLFVCCGQKVYALLLPSLNLYWDRTLDMATCFEIYEYEDDLIVHGEVEISRLTTAGETKWQFSGRDIFVTMDGKKEFQIIEGGITLIDFQGYKYVLDGNGKLIE